MTPKGFSHIGLSTLDLDRTRAFRVSIGLGTATYVRLFGPKPKRPAKGGVVALPQDFTVQNQLMPHPVYAWMGWAQILSPTREVFVEIFPHIKEAYRLAVAKFTRKTTPA